MGMMESINRVMDRMRLYCTRACQEEAVRNTEFVVCPASGRAEMKITCHRERMISVVSLPGLKDRQGNMDLSLSTRYALSRICEGCRACEDEEGADDKK